VLRELRIGMGSLDHRTGRGFEEAVRRTIEEFAGLGPLQAQRLVLVDEVGEVFGVPGQAIEFDAFVHDGHRFPVKAKGFADTEDVLTFHRKLQLAEGHGDGPFERLMIAPFAHPRAVRLAERLGIACCWPNRTAAIRGEPAQPDPRNRRAISGSFSTSDPVPSRHTRPSRITTP
jgi:hypothetical protein